MNAQPTSPERISLGAGLCAIMLATLPRYVAGGHDTRLVLMLGGVVAILVVTAVQWRWLGQAGRQRLPGLFARLAGLLALGVVLALGWYAAVGTAQGLMAVGLSHGATLGLLFYAVTLWRR